MMRKIYTILTLALLLTSQVIFAQRVTGEKPVRNYTENDQNLTNEFSNITISDSISGNKNTQIKVEDVSVWETRKNIPKMNIYPNPARNSTIINYYSAQAGSIDIHIFDLSGTNVKKIKRMIEAGNNRIEMNVSTLNSGLYFVRVKHLDFKTTKKLIIK